MGKAKKVMVTIHRRDNKGYKKIKTLKKMPQNRGNKYRKYINGPKATGEGKEEV